MEEVIDENEHVEESWWGQPGLTVVYKSGKVYRTASGRQEIVDKVNIRGPSLKVSGVQEGRAGKTVGMGELTKQSSWEDCFKHEVAERKAKGGGSTNTNVCLWLFITCLSAQSPTVNLHPLSCLYASLLSFSLLSLLFMFVIQVRGSGSSRPPL